MLYTVSLIIIIVKHYKFYLTRSGPGSSVNRMKIVMRHDEY